MISTNTTQPAPAGGPVKTRIVTTNALPRREFALTQREYPGVVKLQTRKVTGKLTTENLEERARIAKRAACTLALKKAKAELAAKAKEIDAAFMKDLDAAYDAETERSAQAAGLAKRGRSKKAE